MKFSEISEQSWGELQPYLDTCLLPVSGLTGLESPWEAKERILSTGDWLAHLEQAFHGRTVTLPAFHYDQAGLDAAVRLNELCERLKESGFRYVIVVSGHVGGVSDSITAADLRIQPGEGTESPDSGAIRQAVSAMWRAGTGRV
jgi:23S rRNA (pseudouridine1915-N3)-methyltransferase